RPLAWVRRGWPGQVFGDEEFYCYRLDRRISLMSCCVCLLTIALFISSVAMLPARIGWEIHDGKAFEPEWDHLALGVMAGTVLVIAMVAFTWLVLSIIGWMISGRRHFRGYIGALLALSVGAGMITFVGMGLITIFRDKPPEQIFFFLRATEMASGVSILL